MSSQSRLVELLSIWHDAYAAGREVPVADLCRSCPELAEELERQIDALRRAQALGAAASPAAEPTTGSNAEVPTPSPAGFGAARSPGAGERLGGFRLLRLLGAGGMGQVFEAEDDKLPGRRVALKVMHGHIATRPETRDRFVHEARAMAALQHDHIVPLYQVGEDHGVPFLVMPLLEGQSLERRLRDGPPLTPDEAIRIARQTLAALVAAHAAGRVHRDIKPANLWLETLPHCGPAAPPWRIKVLDFGLARAVSGPPDLTPSGAVLGTPGYMAPEQAVGRAADTRSDLFSLGCVLYRLLARQPPFQGKTLTALLLAVVRDDPTPLGRLRPDLSPRLCQLVMQLLAKDPAQRPPSAAATDELLQTLSADKGDIRTAPTLDFLSASDASTVSQPASGSVEARKRRMVALLGLGTLVAALLLVTLASTWFVRTGAAPATGPNTGTNPRGNRSGSPLARTRYRGEIRVRIERQTAEGPKLLELTDPRALPMRLDDRFRIDARVQPAAYLYVVWVDPGKDVTPVYPWDPTRADNWNSRPNQEEAITDLSLPANAGKRFKTPRAKPGMATIVLLARATPFDEPDERIRDWFEALPELPLIPGRERGVIWFDDYVAVTDDGKRAGTFQIVDANDPFAVWQGQLQQSVGPRAAFETAISFARKDGP